MCLSRQGQVTFDTQSGAIQPDDTLTIAARRETIPDIRYALGRQPEPEE